MMLFLAAAMGLAVAAAPAVSSAPGDASLGSLKLGNAPLLHPAACVALTDPGQISSPTVITFDELPAGTSIGEFYRRTHGVAFAESRTARVVAYDHPLPRSAPMTALSDTSDDPVAVALNFTFDAAQTNVGMFLGNGGGVTTARLKGFDADGNLLCESGVAAVPDGHTAFIGFRDDSRSVVSVSLAYVGSTQAESLDDLHFSAVVPATATPSATLRASPTATLTPTAIHTPTPTPTAEPMLSWRSVLSAWHSPASSLAWPAPPARSRLSTGCRSPSSS